MTRKPEIFTCEECGWSGTQSELLDEPEWSVDWEAVISPPDGWCPTCGEQIGEFIWWDDVGWEWH